MALPFISGTKKKRDQLIAIDLGGRTTKAVHVQRKDRGFELLGYALLDAPIYEKTLSSELLAEHLQSICQTLDAKTRCITLALGVNDAIVRHADLPPIPVGELRQALKVNSRNYLQQDLHGYVFDCYVMAPRAQKPAPERGKNSAANTKHRVLVGGAKQQLVDEMQAALRSAGLVADCMMPGLIAPVNAFEMAMPQVFAQEVVALVDIGFKSSSICLLQEGELILSRVVGHGGDKVTSGLAEGLGVSYAEAEGIKVGMPAEVQSNLEALMLPLGRELKASIDFFEHQQDRAVSQVFVAGGSARSDLLVQTLQTELMVECKPWNPLGFMQLSLPPQQMAEVEHVVPQLDVAVGAAVATF